MDISSDKQVRLHTRRPGHGEERETSREKLNHFNSSTKQWLWNQLYISEN